MRNLILDRRQSRCVSENALNKNMPWCEECSKYFAPSAMMPDGSCPKCLKPIADVNINGGLTAKTINIKKLAQNSPDEDISVPWHFKLLVGALIGYLSWRVIDLFR